MQIDAGLAVAVTLILVNIVTVTVAEPVHPLPFEAETEYIVVVAGVTVAGLPAIVPGSQLYVVPPLAVNTELCPRQMLGGAAVAVTIRFGDIVTCTVVDPVHPLASVAETE